MARRAPDTVLVDLPDLLRVGRNGSDVSSLPSIAWRLSRIIPSPRSSGRAASVALPAQHFRGLEIDYKLRLGWLLNWQVGPDICQHRDVPKPPVSNRGGQRSSR